MSGRRELFSGKLHCHGGSRFSCSNCGRCCSTWDIPLSRDEKDLIERHAAVLEPKLGPKETWFRPYKKDIFLMGKKGDDCIFLDSSKLCQIHSLVGENVKPLACRLFPFDVFVWADGDASASWRYLCPEVGAPKGKDLPESARELRALASEIASFGRLSTAEYGSGRHEIPTLKQLRIIAGGYRKFLTHSEFEPRVRVYAAARLIEFHALTAHRADIVDAGDWFVDDAFNFVSRSTDDLLQAIEAAAPLNANMRISFRYLVSGFLRANEESRARFSPVLRVRRAMRVLAFSLGGGSLGSIMSGAPDSSGLDLLEVMSRIPCDEKTAMPLYWDYLSEKLSALHFCGNASLGLNFQEGMRHLLLSYPATRGLAALIAASEEREKIEASDVRRALTIIDHTFSRSPFFALRHVRKIEKKLCSCDIFPSLLKTLRS